MSTPKQFVRWITWLLSHCGKKINGEYCPKWRVEISGDEFCGDVNFIERPKCTRFRKGVPHE
jgi:hypothetical protein